MPRRALPAWLVAATALGCGGNEFQSGGGSGGSGAGTGGSGPIGGTGGDAGMPTGGSSGSAGTGPTGGTGGMPCTCGPTTYCRGGSCLACSELSTLDFGAPTLLLDNPSASVRFPRVGDAPDSLFYRVGEEGSAQLWYTQNPTALGAFIGDAMVNQQSGALFVGNGLDPSFNLVFDETSMGARLMRGATWNGSALGSKTNLPSPLSPGSFEVYSPAVATGVDPERFYWMSMRDGTPALRTGEIGTGDDDIVAIDVPKRAGSGTCPLRGADATPWVTPDGRRMFFRAFPFDDSCQPIDSGTTDLFVVPITPATGMPTQPALALPSLNQVGSTETDPSLSPDFCTLYFASDRDSPGTSDFKLYRAARR